MDVGWEKAAQPKQRQKRKGKGLKGKCKSREIQPVWEMASSMLREAWDTGKALHTIPTRHLAWPELSVQK